MIKDTRSIGRNFEDLAENYLKSQGYKILNRNYTIRGGEIDIVAKDGGILVFVEVKARFSAKYGQAIESITPWKIQALLKTARFYIQMVKWGDKPYRFDLVTMDLVRGSYQVKLIKNILEG